MKTFITSILIIATIAGAQGQFLIETSLQKSSEDEKSYCVNVDLENNEAIAQNLVGQNIRFFYNSEALSYDKTFMDGEIQESLYNIDVKSNVKGLNKEEGNQLAFDNNMGFVNYSITSNNDKEQVVIRANETLHAQTVCFTKITNTVTSEDVVLAQAGVSDDYSRAYVQVEVTPLNDEVLYPISLLEVDDQKSLVGIAR